MERAFFNWVTNQPMAPTSNMWRGQYSSDGGPRNRVTAQAETDGRHLHQGGAEHAQHQGMLQVQPPRIDTRFDFNNAMPNLAKGASTE